MAVGDTGYTGELTAKVDPAPHLQPYRWKKGQRPANSGKPKGLFSLRKRFRDAFAVAVPGTNAANSLVDVVLEIARDRDDPKQMEAIKFAAAYGFGMPSKNLDDDTVARLAVQMMSQACAEAEARKAAALEATTVDVTGEVVG